MKGSKLVIVGAVAAATMSVACGGTESEKGGVDLTAITADGKGDIGNKAKVIDAIGPQSTITGEFDPRTRVYGYVVEANRGARLNVALEALAGSDATALNEGDELDTTLAVYGPYTDRRNPGELLAESDDGEESFAAPPVDLQIKEDGRYLIAFMSYDDTGAGEYTLSLGCEGTDFQCRRPNFEEKECKEGQLFVQGGEVNEDTVWDSCEVVLLEPTTVAAETILTIDPGVTVKGNYLQDNNNNARFGTVTLTVNGTLQAAGTPENPIRFTSLTENGWGGLVLAGQSNSIENAFIDNANNAITLRTGASAEVSDVVLDGELHQGEDNVVSAQNGIFAQADAQATFRRALVHGFQSGLRAQQSDQLLIEDSVIRNNQTGVVVEGERRITRCSNQSPPQVWRDPEIRYTDIYKNENGIRIEGGDALLKVEYSNIVDNQREALRINGATLHEESYLRNNNIVRNNGGEGQVRTLHRSGQIDLSMNYWKDISDPELSANWTATCGGAIDFSGFHPQAVEEAGPREEELVDDVKQDKLNVQEQVAQSDEE